MKNIYDVLAQKRLDRARLQEEIEALELVIPLVVEEQPMPDAQVDHSAAFTPQSTGTDGPTFSSLGSSESSFWKRKTSSSRR
jgi:hypothetical protein